VPRFYAQKNPTFDISKSCHGYKIVPRFWQH